MSGLAAAPALSACGTGPRSGGATGERAEIALSRVSRAAARPSDRAPAVEVVQGFGAELYRQLAGGVGNLVCSPYSAAVALAMTRNGARGRTAVEMDRVLQAPQLDDLNRGFNALQQHLDARAGTREQADRSIAEISLEVANSLWAQRGLEWRSSFLDALARNYGAGLQLVDFVNDTESARQEINGWTSQRTRGRIKELIPPEVLDLLTRLVLVNAVYLKAPWEEPFERDATRPGAFSRLDGSRVTVPMMRATLRSAGYGEGPDWKAVDLRYAGSELAMAVVLPEPDRFDEVEHGLDGAALHRVLTEFITTAVDLDLPRWRFRTQLSLKSVLAELGMPTAFTRGADFSGMTTQEQLLIDPVLHEAFVAVDEQGTEAAAATAVVVRATSALPARARVVVDRPFLFVIHDRATATPLFIGRVTDPAS